MANKFAQIVFTIKVASADVETYFSRSKYMKNLHRSRLIVKSSSHDYTHSHHYHPHVTSLNDDLVSSTLTVSKTKNLSNKEVLCVYDGSQNVQAAWSVTEDGLDDLTKKYVGGRVSKDFVCDDESNVRKYIGEVTHVHFVPSETQYLIHVSYLSDDDSEDLEEWQVRDLWVGYE